MASPTRSPSLSRLLLTWLIEAATLFILASFNFGLTITNFRAALAAIAVIGLLNALVRPLIVKLTLPITAITLGLFSLLINAFILIFAARLLPGLTIASWGWAVVISIGLTVFNTLFSYLLHVNDADSYYYGVIKKAAKKATPPVKTTKAGFFYLEIDGLGYPVFRQALKQGYLPQLQAYLKAHHYQIIPWETDLSPQTPSSQAGILHGNNHNMPAFRWYDRRLGKLVSGSNPQDAAAIEAERSNGQGLLADNGFCVNNLFSGDANQSTLTISTLLKKRAHRSQPLYYYFVNPYNYAHTLASVTAELYHEWHDARFAKSHHLEPSITHRGLEFMLMRAVLNVYLADISFAVAIGELLSGRSALYLTAAGYDDIAHHTGILSPEALASLQRLDTHLSHLFQAAKDAPRPYHFIFLSDHGQSNGPNFLKKFGYTLGDLVNRHLSQNTFLAEITDRDEAYGNTNKLLTEITRQFQPSRREAVAVGAEVKELQPLTGSGKTGPLPPVLVMASGNLGLVNFTDTKKRLTLEAIVKRHPQLIPALIKHPGLSFIMVKSQIKGTVILGRTGTYYLKTGRVDGHNPLKDFGPHVVRHLKRHDTFPHIPDILINSYFDPKTQTVYAFEDFVGSHGGLGGPQGQPFLAFPNSLPAPKSDLISAESIYRVLKSWQQTTI
ncbi:hypothetical protein A2W24_05080 [Microgenomates group bacterium RBG_16_45_19]|nr:MAG: hypothetical protein A2W24_05080 [Microgenomates group bacterium RBG_16_45_19]